MELKFLCVLFRDHIFRPLVLSLSKDAFVEGTDIFKAPCSIKTVTCFAGDPSTGSG